MKKNIRIWTLGIAASLLMATGLMAQEQIEVSVKVTKDGAVISDTTYQFEEASQAKHAIKMMKVLSGDDEHMEHITYNITSAHTDGGHSKAMVFISEDGDKFNITELQSDSLVWVSEGDEPHGEHVIVMKSKDGNSFDVLVDEDHKGEKVVKKKVKVVVPEGEDVKWHVEGDEMIHDKDENVFIIKGDDDVKMKVMKIMEDGSEEEEVKVIVIKKGEKVHVDCDHDHDEDCDHDHEEDCDHEHDEDVEVKVVKKKIKK